MIDSHLLRIIHRTHYWYAQPVRFESHRLVIRPREGHDLRVEQLDLSIIPRAEVGWTRDIFGNSIALVHFHERSMELRFDMNVVVRRFFDPGSPPRGSHSENPYPLVYAPLEQNIVSGYLAPVFIEDGDCLRSWIATLPGPCQFPNTEAFVLRLAGIIHERFRYERRETKGVQSPATTVSIGSGSCRDFATLMMEALRHLGIAARFASGYLDCASAREATGSTHAWTEVYFPEIGWRGFDPTSGDRCDSRHIVTGTSHHPRGVMPVTGKFYGAPGAFLGLTVGVEFSTPG